MTNLDVYTKTINIHVAISTLNLATKTLAKENATESKEILEDFTHAL